MDLDSQVISLNIDPTREASYNADNIQPLTLTEAVSEDEILLTKNSALKNRLSTGGNPFLPSHILQQLRQDHLNIVQEIAQSGEALTASTALIRSATRSKPSNFMPRDAAETDEKRINRYKMIDDLVGKYLPVIEADLRRKLRAVVDSEIA